MSQAKDQHYWGQLRAALTAGEWASSSPAKAPNGSPLPWPELLRKFKKHCKGFQDIAEVASQTQALSLLLAGGTEDGELDGGKTAYGYLELGTECALVPERQEEGTNGYNALRILDSSNYDSIKLTLAYYAYALGRPEECLEFLSRVPNLSEYQSRVNPLSATVSSATSASLQVPGTANGSATPSLSGSFLSEASASFPDIKEGRAWAITESIRSVCLEGMSLENIHPTDTLKAFEAYKTVIPLVSAVNAELPKPSPATTTAPSNANSAGNLDLSAFTRYREYWRWTERLLWRLICLVSRTISLDTPSEADEEGSLWTLFNVYHTCSAHWPPTFRPDHRSTIAALYMRAYVLRSRLNSPAQPKIVAREGPKAPAWLSSARSVAQEYRQVLNLSTTFPKAGERNIKVEEFIDMCVAIWEASGAIGEQAGWVIDNLWWATRLTFNSHRVYRHMTRLLYVHGDQELAKRTLRLYAQVVSKARETATVEAEAGTGAREEFSNAVDVDTDRHWVETLVFGARMLCRLAQAKSGGDGLDEAKEAGVMIEKAKTRMDDDDKELKASVDLAEGVWSSMMAIKEQDPHTREQRISHSLICFIRSIGTFPTASAYYHLALALSRPGPDRDFEKAIEYARLAVDEGPSEIRYLHLLGLLLVKTGDWRKSRVVLELGAAIGEGSSEGGTPGQNGSEEDNIRVKDYGSDGNDGAVEAEAVPSSIAACERKPPPSLLDLNSRYIPAAQSLLLPYPDHPPPSMHESFEQALQLRLTQLALAEMVEGSEGAGDKWVEVFGWCAEQRSEEGERQRRLSIDSRRPSVSVVLERLSEVDLTCQLGPSQLAEPRRSIDGARSTKSHNDAISPTQASIPITLTPATPVVPSHNGQIEGLPHTENLLDEMRSKRSDYDPDSGKGKKVQQMLKTRVHKGQARISTIGKKIGHGVTRNGSIGNRRRSNSTPNFQAVLGRSPYQASSIHRASRKHLASSVHSEGPAITEESAPPPPPSSSGPQPALKWNTRAAREQRLLSELWLMSAATFRRLGKIEQAKGAIQEAEVRDEKNPGVWVQLGLYYLALNNHRRAKEALQKALFLAPEDISATIHLARLYMTPITTSSPSSPSPPSAIDRANIDLAAGMLDDLTRGPGWDIAEAWYFLGKAYGLQGRKDRERDCLHFALGLAEGRGVRDVGVALGWCL